MMCAKPPWQRCRWRNLERSITWPLTQSFLRQMTPRSNAREIREIRGGQFYCLQNSAYSPLKRAQNHYTFMTLLQHIREQKPLIYHLTNEVTKYDCAQVTRAIGALPVMTHPSEAAQMAQIASALVLNIGTLSWGFIDGCIAAGKVANERGIPIVLDAVGCGATSMRNEAMLRLLTDLDIAILKGNAGEIASISGANAEVRGVESIGKIDQIDQLAQVVARQFGCVVVVSGVVDIITDGKIVTQHHGGHPVMGQVVGTGCTLASALGCFVAGQLPPFGAAQECLEYYTKCAENAAKSTTQPMEWKALFYDTLAA